MAPPTLTLHLTLLTLLFLSPSPTSAQCYYPNGAINDHDGPCPNSDLCCPVNWECLSNGLCRLPDADPVLERHTCTDETWSSSECPNFCTYSAAGNEMILQCSDGSYCCDGNGSFDCCEGDLPEGTDYFDLPDGEVVGSVTALSPASTTARESSSEAEETSSSSSSTGMVPLVPLPTQSERSSSAESTSTAKSSRTTNTPDSSASSPTATSSTTASESFSTTGSSLFEPTSKPDADAAQPPDENHSSFSLGAIIGLTIGIAALVVFCAFLAFLLYRRHKKSKIQKLAVYTPPQDPPQEIKYNPALPPGTHAPELDSEPKASTYSRFELAGSEPSSGAGAGTSVRDSGVSSLTVGAQGQGYSPTSMVSPAVSTAGGGGMGRIEEKDEPPPRELWSGPVYRPYRPGMERQGDAGQGAQGGFGGQGFQVNQGWQAGHDVQSGQAARPEHDSWGNAQACEGT